MPIQWSGAITSPYKLAQVIQGEAGSAAGQFAVASVMYNRTTDLGAGLVAGGGSGDISQVVTPTQFNGFSSTPSPYAQSLANDLWAGNAPQGGSTGNALFFAAPKSSNAAWANPNTASGQGLFNADGNNVGGNYYSDTLGPPSSNFQAPDYGGTPASATPAPNSGLSSVDGGPMPDTVGGPSVQNDAFDNADAMPGAANPSSALSLPDAAGGSTDQTDPLSIPGGLAPSNAASVPGGSLLTQAAGSEATAPSVSSAAGDVSGAGKPVNITDISNAGQVGDEAIAKATGQAASTAASTANTVAQSQLVAGQSWFTGLENTFTDLTVRGGLILLALVILFGAWMLFGDGKKDVEIAIARA